MSTDTVATVRAEVADDRPPRWRHLSFQNASVLYVFIALVVVFGIWVPDTFLTTSVWRTLLDGQAITVLVAIGLTIPLAAGVFNLAIGAELGLGAIVVAWLMVERSIPAPLAVILAVAVGGVVGLLHGLLVVRMRIDSFIATLGMSSVLLAVIAWISGGRQILGLGPTMQDLALKQIAGVTLPVWVMLVLAAVVWYVLEWTPIGRRVYATGGNPEAARAAGVNTKLVVVSTLVACGLLTAFAGVILSARLATGDPTVGPAYMLPAFTAAFLGSTQFHGGRFNVWGTVAAAYVLATGIKGLQLAGAPVWIPDLFNGVALLVAVGLARWERTGGRTGGIRRLLRR